MAVSDYTGLTTRTERWAVTGDLLLNGHTLDHYFVDSADGWITVGAAEPATAYKTVPGRAGALDLSLVDMTGTAFPGNRTITFEVVASGDDLEITEAKLAVGALAGKQATLQWRTLPGHFAGRLTVGAWTDTHVGRRAVQSTCTLTLTASPYLIGATEVVELYAGENPRTIKGNSVTRPTLSWTDTDDPNSDITKNASFYVKAYPQLKLEVSWKCGQTPLLADCANRRWTVECHQLVLPLASSWLALPPGDVIICASQAATMTYVPYWLI